MAEVNVTEAEDAAAAATDEEPFEEYDAPEGRRGEADDELATEPGNGRKTLAELAAEAPEAEASDEDEGDVQPRLFGTDSRITSAVKGRRPDTSHVKFKAAAIEVSGQFHADDVLELRMTGQLDKVEFVNKRDGEGKVKAVKRVHHVSAITVEQVSLSADLLRKRLQFVADELGVDADALAQAQERAAAEVQPDAQ